MFDLRVWEGRRALKGGTRRTKLTSPLLRSPVSTLQTYNNIWCHWIRYVQISKPLEKKVEEEAPEEENSDDEIVE